jgi:hypothetical protein
MDSLYRSGVPYISREEEEKAVAKAIERQNQTAASTSLDVKETDHESLAFLQVVRQLVDKWLALGDVFFYLPASSTHLTVSIEARKVPQHSAPNWCNQVPGAQRHAIVIEQIPKEISPSAY